MVIFHVLRCCFNLICTFQTCSYFLIKRWGKIWKCCRWKRLLLILILKGSDDYLSTTIEFVNVSFFFYEMPRKKRSPWHNYETVSWMEQNTKFIIEETNKPARKRRHINIGILWWGFVFFSISVGVDRNYLSHDKRLQLFWFVR